MKKNKTPQGGVFNPYVARFWVKLWMRCYQEGIYDAYDAQDPGECHEWLEYTSRPGYYGFMKKRKSDYIDDLLLWLSELSYDINMRNVFKRYVRDLGRGTRIYYNLAYHVAQEFYNKGLRDFIDAPCVCSMEDFRLMVSTKKGVRPWPLWTRSGIKMIDRDQVVDIAHDILGYMQDLYTETGFKLSPSAASFKIFRRCINQARVGYVDYS
ncbi:MAG: hypothetical protein HDS14_00435 [Bacteroides sp.]|nr:hypothetical protein [Bacteroides sp.]